MAHPRRSSEPDSTRSDNDTSGDPIDPVLSVLRRQRIRSARHLTCSVSAELRSTRRLDEVTSNASSSARRLCFTLPILPRFYNTAQAHERSEGVARPAHLKASSEAEATTAPILIATVRGRSTAHRWADKNGQLALTNGGYSILQSGSPRLQASIENTASFGPTSLNPRFQTTVTPCRRAP